MFLKERPSLIKDLLESTKGQGFYSATTTESVVSELELKIRKKVLANLDELRKRSESAPMTPRVCGLVAEIQSNLEMLWGEND